MAKHLLIKIKALSIYYKKLLKKFGGGTRIFIINGNSSKIIHKTYVVTTQLLKNSFLAYLLAKMHELTP